MTKNLKRAPGTILAIACLCTLCGCRTSVRPRDYSAERNNPADLLGGIEAMLHDYTEAEALGLEKGAAEDGIPPGYWCAAIRAFKPIRVCTSPTDHIIVIQRGIGAVEYGKLLVPEYSSSMPARTNILPLSGFLTNGVVVYDYVKSQQAD